MQGRGLSSKTYEYIKEVRFTIGEKKLYAIGFENLSEALSFAILFKGSLLKKDISIINLNSSVQDRSNVQDKNIKSVAVLKVLWMPCLLEMQKSFSGDILVMNSIALLKIHRTSEKYSDINLFR